MTTLRDLWQGLARLAALGKPLRPAITTCKSTRAATAPFVSKVPRILVRFGRAGRGMYERSLPLALALLVFNAGLLAISAPK